MNLITLQRARELLTYEPGTGLFRWNVKPNRRICIGTVAGTVRHDGYIEIMLDGETIMAHRLAWFMTHGSWPSDIIDHRNRVKVDNRIDNLRDADKALNAANAKSRNQRLPGVTLDKRRGVFFSSIKRGPVKRYLGAFPTPEEANAAYMAARRELYPEIDYA